MTNNRKPAEPTGAKALVKARKLRTYDALICVSTSFFVGDINATDRKDAEAIARQRWHDGGLSPVESSEEIDRVYIDEVRS